MNEPSFLANESLWLEKIDVHEEQLKCRVDEFELEPSLVLKKTFCCSVKLVDGFVTLIIQVVFVNLQNKLAT